MKRVKFILFYLSVFCGVCVSAQTNIQLTWDEIRAGLNEGKEEYFYYLLDLKEKIETFDSWDENIKGTYISTIRLLSDVSSKNNLFDIQEVILKDAWTSFEQHDSIFNTNYKREILNSFTTLYYNVKDYQNLIKCGLKGIEMCQEVSDFGLTYLSILYNMGCGALSEGDYESANNFINEGFNRLNGLTRTSQPQSLNIIRMVAYISYLKGRVEYRLGNYSEAEDYYNISLKYASSYDIKPLIYNIQNNIGVLYYYTGRKNEALQIFDELKLKRPSVDNYLNLLTLRYSISTEKTTVLEELKSYNNLRYQQTINIQNILGEEDFENFIDSFTDEMIWHNNMIASKYPNTIKEAFDANLFTRSIESARRVGFRKTFNENDSIKKEIQTLRIVHNKKTSNMELRDSISMIISDIESTCFRMNPQIFNEEVNYVSCWDSIREKLNEDDICIMFCYIPNVCDSIKSSNYGVFAGTSQMKEPILLNLCGVDELEDIYFNDTPDPLFISNLYSNGSVSKVYQKLWEPLEFMIKDKKNIYYSLTGSLYLINHEALSIGGERLGEKYNLILCSSPARIIDTKTEPKIVGYSAALFGEPNFNMDIDDMKQNANQYTLFSGLSLDDLNYVDYLRSEWGPLPSTIYEVEEANNLLKEKGYSTILHIGNDACEEAFKELSENSPSIIHIASHGYNLNNDKKIENSNFANELEYIGLKSYIKSLSGIILSGGNYAWCGGKITDNIEDGILTSEEISRLNLSNTKLVILSACETGLGWIDPIEGVLGLHKAFKDAGVKTILMTLWKVPDSTTYMFTQEFYKNLVNDKSPREATRKAQQYLIEAGAADPYYWAPFVVLD